MTKKIHIHANSNFHTLTSASVFDCKSWDTRFQEYRKRWFEYPANFIVGEFPIHLDIESTSFCNLRCPFCASTYDNWGPGKKGFMEFGTFKRIIDEGIQHDLFSIKLSLRGEPLLHKQLSDMIRYAKEAGVVDIYFNTNAVLLTGDMVNRLIESGLNRISISFEGITKEVYERHRVGARYEDVVENIKRLRSLRDKTGGVFPQIRIQTVLLPELKDSFKDYVAFWKTIVDEVSYLDARDETQKDYHCEQKECSIENKGNWACSYLWQRMMILWDGTVMPCLMHGVKDFTRMSLGNVAERSLRSMWESDDYKVYRAFHQRGESHMIEACRYCSHRAMELQKLKNTSI